jgi:heme/copper-type cytochrome/quinol oxidase subunit 2
MEATVQTQAFSVLAAFALVLMVVVTGGVAYLTAAEWRDRRRRQNDQQTSKRDPQISKRSAKGMAKK